MGKHTETVQYQWQLHRNLMYLASIADSNQNLQNLLPVSKKICLAVELFSRICILAASWHDTKSGRATSARRTGSWWCPNGSRPNRSAPRTLSECWRSATAAATVVGSQQWRAAASQRTRTGCPSSGVGGPATTSNQHRSYGAGASDCRTAPYSAVNASDDGDSPDTARCAVRVSAAARARGWRVRCEAAGTPWAARRSSSPYRSSRSSAATPSPSASTAAASKYATDQIDLKPGILILIFFRACRTDWLPQVSRQLSRLWILAWIPAATWTGTNNISISLSSS